MLLLLMLLLPLLLLLPMMLRLLPPDVARVADHVAVVHATGDREENKHKHTCNGTARWSNVGLMLWSNVV